MSDSATDDPRRRRGSRLPLLPLIISLLVSFLRVAVAQDDVGWQYTGKDLPRAEYDALLDFKSSISDDGGLLSTWTNASHPCKWNGVLCLCRDVYPPQDDCPTGADADPVHEHVYGLDFGPSKPPNKRLEGTLSPRLAALQEARILYLHDNKLRGTIPPEFGDMPSLRRLIVRDNLLTGTLPPQLGNANYKDLYFYNNNLTGSIPDHWCNLANREDSRLNAINPGNNELLCGKIPECFRESPSINTKNLAGTCLDISDIPSRTADDPRSYSGGLCDSTPPVCSWGNCLLTPGTVSSHSYFNFSFVPFEDPESGVLKYRPERLQLEAKEEPLYSVGTMEVPAAAMPPKEKSADDVDPSTGLYNAEFTARDVALHNGRRYHVTLEVVNGACPELTERVVSAPILVDTTPPYPDKAKSLNGQDPVYGNGACNFAISEQLYTEPLRACWLHFLEDESSITHYTAAVVRETDEGVEMLVEHTQEGIECDSEVCRTTARGLSLSPGDKYRFVIRAYNEAGDSRDWYSSLIKAVEPPAAVSREAIILISSCVSALVVLTAAVFIFSCAWAHRQKKYREALGLQRETSKLATMLRDTVVDMLGPSTSFQAQGLEGGHSVLGLSEVFFVFTDIEESSSLGSADPAAFAMVQEIHDSVMHRNITAHDGYEIITQGDAFEVAFHSASAAVSFSLKVQEDLLQTQWPPKVLALPMCRGIVAKNGELLFKGPRIRMGIHLGREGTFERRINPMTQRIQFGGLSYLMVEELSDSGHGGQILMSGDAFEAAVHKEGLPRCLCVFSHIGSFKLPKAPGVVPVYEVCPPLTSSVPRRVFPMGLRKAVRISMGTGNCVQPSLVGSTPPGYTGLVAVVRPGNTTDPGDLEIYYNTLSAVAQMFRAFSSDNGSPSVLLFGLPDGMEAARFCMVAQVALMNAVGWSKRAAHAKYTVAGVPLFKGPRVAMLATTGELEIAPTSAPPRPGSHLPMIAEEQGRMTETPVTYRLSGEAVDIATRLCWLARPGQVVLTTALWHKLQEVTLKGMQVLSLGTHVVEEGGTPVALMEILPTALADRQFQAVPSLKCLDPGFRDAPPADSEIAIMFLKVPSCPQIWPGNGTGAGGLRLEDAHAIHAAAIQQYCALVRAMLQEFCGYECKESQGKMMLCFSRLDNAIAFAVHLQVRLLGLSWDCRLQAVLAAGGENPGRGLAPAIGISWGRPAFKKPSGSTGRADYFGPLANCAARCTSSAVYGQVLVDGRHLRRVMGAQFPEHPNTWVKPPHVHLLPHSRVAPMKRSSIDGLRDIWLEKNADAEWEREVEGLPQTTGSVHMKGLGLFHLKGFPQPVSLVQAWLPQPNSRAADFPVPPNNILAHSEEGSRDGSGDGSANESVSTLLFG